MSSDHPEGYYLDFILRSGAERAALSCILGCLQGIRSQWDTIKLVRVDSGSKSISLLSQLAGDYGLMVLVRPEAPCVWDELPQEYGAFFANIPSPKTRRNIRRAQRLVDEHFVSVDWLDFSSPSETDEFLFKAADLHTERFRHLGKTGAFADPKWFSNMREVARLFAERGWLRLRLLRLDGVDVAARIGFVLNGTWYGWQTGWLPKYAKYEVSHLLWARCVQDCIAEGLKAYDVLLGSEHSYKAKYLAQRRWLVSITLSDERPRSAGNVGRELLTDGLRPIVRRWTPWAAWCLRQLRHWGRARRLSR